jgi:hypothetical protein
MQGIHEVTSRLFNERQHYGKAASNRSSWFFQVSMQMKSGQETYNKKFQMFLVQNRGFSDSTQNIVCYEIDNSLPTQNRAQDKVSGASVVELESEDNFTGKSQHDPACCQDCPCRATSGSAEGAGYV